MSETNSPILSKETARRIWNANIEIENAIKLRDEVQAILDSRSPNPRDAAECRWRERIELSVPTSNVSSRLFNVDPKLAIHVINAHIVNQQSELAAASIAARIELDAALSKGQP